MHCCEIKRGRVDGVQIEGGPDISPEGSAKRLERRAMPGPLQMFTLLKSGRVSLNNYFGKFPQTCLAQERA
jgi:hypothetical protein